MELSQRRQNITSELANGEDDVLCTAEIDINCFTVVEKNCFCQTFPPNVYMFEFIGYVLIVFMCKSCKYMNQMSMSD